MIEDEIHNIVNDAFIRGACTTRCGDLGMIFLLFVNNICHSSYFITENKGYTFVLNILRISIYIAYFS